MVPHAGLVDHWYDGEYVLKCPVCGFDYTHHGNVEDFVRAQEDAPSMLRRPGSNVISPTTDNPSSRRDAVRIRFHCEEGHHWHLDIAQHKGQTLVTADVDDEDRRAEKSYREKWGELA
jgi:hypothetical protein